MHKLQEKQKITSIDPKATNLKWARDWYKTQVIPTGVSFRGSSAGGPIGGILENSLIEISYRPPFGMPVPSLCLPVDTRCNPQDFKENLLRAFDKVVVHAKKCDEKIQRLEREGALKGTGLPKIRKMGLGLGSSKLDP